MAYALDTLIVYVFALHISEMLVFRFFAWIAPALQISIAGSPADWYLRHLELAITIPALAAGYINVGRFVPALLGGRIDDRHPSEAAFWAWTMPTFILLWRMFQYRDPTASVIFSNHVSALRYFFEIQQTMPSRSNFLAIDSERVLAQMTFTAPFYAGIAYTVGAIAAKYRGVQKAVAFLQPERIQLPEEESTTPAPPSSLAD